MKINIIIPFTSLTGGVRIIFEYANRLMKKNHDVVIYSLLIPYKIYYPRYMDKLRMTRDILKNIKKWNKVDWFDLNVPIKIIPSVNNKFIRDADIIIATAWPTASQVFDLEQCKGKKVYFVQDYEIWHGHEEQVNYSYKLPMTQIVIASWLRDLMVTKFKKNNVNLIYNGIDFSELYNNKKNINEDGRIVSMLYHHLESKGFADGLKAFEEVKMKLPDLKLILFGSSSGDNIPEYAEFHLKPSREELREIYCKSDLFIFSSRAEGWGLTPLEAMACKCAVAATNTGAIKEIGINGVNTLVSEPGDVKALADNIYKILTDKSLLNRISTGGYETIQKFDWENSVISFEKVLEDCLKDC